MSFLASLRIRAFVVQKKDVELSYSKAQYHYIHIELFYNINIFQRSFARILVNATLL